MIATGKVKNLASDECSLDKLTCTWNVETKKPRDQDYQSYASCSYHRNDSSTAQETNQSIWNVNII